MDNKNLYLLILATVILSVVFGIFWGLGTSNKWFFNNLTSTSSISKTSSTSFSYLKSASQDLYALDDFSKYFFDYIVLGKKDYLNSIKLEDWIYGDGDSNGGKGGSFALFAQVETFAEEYKSYKDLKPDFVVIEEKDFSIKCTNEEISSYNTSDNSYSNIDQIKLKEVNDAKIYSMDLIKYKVFILYRNEKYKYLSEYFIDTKNNIIVLRCLK